MILNIEIEIKGRVQGVGFRYQTRQTAKELNIKGFVRNMSDGSVYILASGSEAAIDKFINWCHLGPRFANVESVNITYVDDNETDDFYIR